MELLVAVFISTKSLRTWVRAGDTDCCIVHAVDHGLLHKLQVSRLHCWGQTAVRLRLSSVHGKLLVRSMLFTEVHFCILLLRCNSLSSFLNV
jgi:hypothetical protein